MVPFTGPFALFLGFLKCPRSVKFPWFSRSVFRKTDLENQGKFTDRGHFPSATPSVSECSLVSYVRFGKTDLENQGNFTDRWHFPSAMPAVGKLSLVV